MTLAEFLYAPNVNRQWVEWNGLSIYLRRQPVLINKVREEFLAIANVSCNRPGRGTYTRLLDYLEQSLPDEFVGIYIENCLEERFHKFHLRRTGW